ncbi:MAG: TAXI family TRAP transporter solute-binding subunit [Flintibacter sp.]|uniref:TAXI family TRAP transporter solute-binding subunit n=1 Tax=Flintibacter TaxID=1918454 RepID=UPI002670F656|nr:TAXI family TRAP transporter solute-binding subunit [Flintibacter sp.]MCI6150214.1 TAXI family TRAP transporter solute-binding subunit [Flintibacter sp.]MCI7660630.1 TAXI family TRAP transporter solute-binding subunit [Flintibacter sp.]MDD7117166.1 TAXI family TRAP transporter solute-binding subunit [Flintibacter sp.]MDY5037958.1 TAXI family TRAP transporter solute-binding subunit [Lawsonibacter sp.]
MKKKLALVLALALTASLSLTACTTSGGTSSGSDSGSGSGSGSGSNTVAETVKGGKDGGTSLNFTTGGDQGTYYGFGSILAQKVGEATSTQVTAITSNGSAANIQAMQDGDAQLGFVQSDVMAYAYEGTRTFKDLGAYSDFSTVASVYMEQVQIVTLDPNIKTVADLAGKRVSIGAPNSGVYFNAVDVLGAYDLTEDDIEATYEDFGTSADSLKDGKIDAAFVVAGAPTTAITSLATTKDVYLVSLDDEHIDKLLETSPYYSKNVISADTYDMDADATTVAVVATVIARNDVSDEDVYNFLFGVYKNIESLTQSHQKGAELDLEFAASNTAVPYHPGAVAFFADEGITVPGK